MARAVRQHPRARTRPLEGPDMDKRTATGGQPRGEDGWFAGYRPVWMDDGVWSEVRPFVVEAAGRLALDGGASAVRVIRVLARLGAWSLGEGLALDAEVVLDPDTVERFVAVGLCDDRSRATYRAVLRRVGPLLTRRAPWETRSAPVARRQVAAPYSPVELDGLRCDALAQPTPGRARAARVLLAFGAGAGLDGRWVARLTTNNVLPGRVVRVRVGEPSARVVPVLACWEDEVLELATSAGGEFLVGGYSTSRNRAGALAASLVVASGHPKFSGSRLRSTWLVAHLAMGTRLPELARAAGLEGLTVLSDLLPFVPELGADEAATILRGSK